MRGAEGTLLCMGDLLSDLGEINSSEASLPNPRHQSSFSSSISSYVETSQSLNLFQELSTSWDIKSTPTFCFLKDGRQVDKLVGGNNPELLKKTAAVADLKSSYVGDCQP